MTLKCVICDKDGEMTVEHIFPLALGGTFELSNVCKICNNYLGTAVDAVLTDHYLLLIKRFQLKISSRKGKVPNPLAGVVTNDAGCQTIFESDKKGNPIGFKQLPSTKETEDGNILVSVDAKDSDQLLPIVKKVYERRGLKPPSDEELLALVQTRQDTATVNRETKIDLLEYHRPVMKIAYELGLAWLGADYSHDDLAIKIRKFLFDPREVHEISSEYQLNGIVDLHPPTYGPGYSWDEVWSQYPHLHLGLMTPTPNGVRCLVRIFDTVYGDVFISQKPEFNGIWPKLIVLDAKNMSYEEYFGPEQVATAMQGAGKYKLQI